MDPTIDEPILEPVAVEPTPTARAAAFTTLAEEEIDAAYRLATLILRDAVEAEDAVHDAFVTAWRNWASLRDPARFDAWFGRILLNVCRMRLRARRRQGGLVDISTVLGASSRDPDPAVVAGQRDAIERGFSRLSPDHRIVVVLRYYLDLPVDRIAERTGVPVGTVKSRLHHALRELGAALRTDEVEVHE